MAHGKWGLSKSNYLMPHGKRGLGFLVQTLPTHHRNFAKPKGAGRDEHHDEHIKSEKQEVRWHGKG